MTQRIEIITVLVDTRNDRRTRADTLDRVVADARGIAPVGQRASRLRADADLVLGRPEKQQACVRRLIAAVEINCKLLTRGGWKIEGKRRSVSYGCGIPVMNGAHRLDIDLLRYLSACATANQLFPTPDAIFGLVCCIWC